MRTSSSPTACPTPPALPVTGALASRNPRNQDWLILGSTTATHTVQDHAKVKVAYEISPQLRISYTLGMWDNEAQRSSETYLRDAAGNPVYSGSINVDGRRYAVTPADFAPTAGDLRHLMHGLSLKSERDGAWNFELAASEYDYDRDVTRSPTVALPDAAAGGAGRIANQRGTGWTSLALRAVRRPGRDDGHILDLGYQLDDFALRTLVESADDWLAGGPDGARLGVSRRHRACERLRAGHLGVRAAVERDARRARRALAAPRTAPSAMRRRRSISPSGRTRTYRRSLRSRAS